MLIGIDFDNTIAGYDDVFSAQAERLGLVQGGEAKSKQEVRTALLARPGGDQDWMRLQGQVYGTYMKDACMIEGVADFLLRCKKSNINLRIVSHKTKFGHFDNERVNLRDAANAWMEGKGFFKPDGFGLRREDVFYEQTRKDKVRRIAQIGCTHFIDDLQEVFLEPDFPATTKRLLFAPGSKQPSTSSYKAFDSWVEISEDLLGGVD